LVQQRSGKNFAKREKFGKPNLFESKKCQTIY
jgi:hypothetical protein